MLRLSSVVSMALALLLSACAVAPQVPVAMKDGALRTADSKVGVIMTALPKVDTDFPGGRLPVVPGDGLGHERQVDRPCPYARH